MKFIDFLVEKYGPVSGLDQSRSSQLLFLYSFSSIFRYYFGRRPIIVISDVEMLKHVMVKELDSFVDRPVRSSS